MSSKDRSFFKSKNYDRWNDEGELKKEIPPPRRQKSKDYKKLWEEHQDDYEDIEDFYGSR